MKANQQLRQNKKISRHITKKLQFPVPHKRAEKVLGKLLLAIPGVRQLLKDIRQEFMSGIDEEGIEYTLNEEEIDWKVIHKELEVRLRKIPNILPKELTKYQKAVEFQKKLPRKVKFNEPITNKLQFDVEALYKGFKKLYNLTVDNLAMPWINAANNFFTVAADNLVEFLKTGVEKEVPSNWINAVQTLTIFGEKVVLVMASDLANPVETAEKFLEEYYQVFHRDGPKFTETDVFVAKYFRMALEKSDRKDIADQYMQENYPDLDPLTDEYKDKKRHAADMLDHSFMRLQNRFDVKKVDKK